MTDKCADRINRELNSREFTAINLLAAAQGIELGEEEEYDEDSIFEFPLAVSLEKSIRIDLSTGGPADWLEVKLSYNSPEVDSVKYHYADWFDHAETDVPEDSPLFELAEFYTNSYGEML